MNTAALDVFCVFGQHQAREDILSLILSSGLSFRRFSIVWPSCITLALQDIPVTKCDRAVVVLALEAVQYASIILTCSLRLHQLTACPIMPC